MPKTAFTKNNVGDVVQVMHQQVGFSGQMWTVHWIGAAPTDDNLVIDSVESKVGGRVLLRNNSTFENPANKYGEWQPMKSQNSLQCWVRASACGGRLKCISSGRWKLHTSRIPPTSPPTHRTSPPTLMNWQQQNIDTQVRNLAWHCQPSTQCNSISSLFLCRRFLRQY